MNPSAMDILNLDIVRKNVRNCPEHTKLNYNNSKALIIHVSFSFFYLANCKQGVNRRIKIANS